MKARFNLVITLLACIIPMHIYAEIHIESAMDWGTGDFSITARRSLDPGVSPSDHPKALAALEVELLPYIVNELAQLAWDREGLLSEHVAQSPAMTKTVEKLARMMNREWSRITEDRKSVEAAYTISLLEVLPELFPPTALPISPSTPIGWVPVPEDDWTGIVIFVPHTLPVRGLGIDTNIKKALFARILTENLEVLADPASGNGKILSYRTVEERNLAEPLIGRRPFLVMARELYGKYACDMILGEEDTRRLLASESGRRVLLESRIVILLESSLRHKRY